MADHTNTAFSDNEPTVDADLNEPDLGSEVESTNDPSVFKTPVKPGRASSPIRSPSNSSSPAQQSDTGSDPTPTPAIENAGHDLETFDWTNLQAEFEAAMESQRVNDDALQAEWAQLMNYHAVWLATPARRDEPRAAKRLRTRIAYVQHQENLLQEKQEHHEKVVKAFEIAMNMLGG